MSQTTMAVRPEAPLKPLNEPHIWRRILWVFLAVLALIGFWPSPVDAPVQGELSGVLGFFHDHGIPSWFNYSFVEAAANVVLFIPVGFVASLAFPDKRWWQTAGLGLMVSGCMELGQLVFLSSRVASPSDLVTNTAGCVLGVVLARAALLFLKNRQAQRHSALSPSGNYSELLG